MSSLKNESTNSVILTASGLAKTYGKGSTAVDVLKEIDLQVSASEKVAIVGSSGSGKSTLLHLLGVDHERLTYKFQGRRFRLTDVEGKVVREILS